MRPLLFYLIFCLIFSINAFSQTYEVCGKVIAFNYYPINDVEVDARKSKETVKTDSMGNFCITCKKRDKLTFNAEGFLKYTKSVREKIALTVNLVYREGDKNKEAVLENGHMNAEDLDYAIKNLLDQNSDFSNYPDIYSLIEGKVMGVNVTSLGDVVIQGYAEPVKYDLDGTVIDRLPRLHPKEVKSLELLKGPEATIYGIRGQNGILKIKTTR